MLPSRVPLLRREAPFNPAQLFAKGATGAWYDPSSLWGAADHLPRRNLLTSTATLATQTKTVTAVSHTLYIKGTGSVTLSGAATGTLNGTGASDRVSLVFTPSAGSLTLTVSGTVTEGHLTLTSTTDHSYQAVTDWTTELYAHAASKNVPWLRRNLALSTIDLSGWSLLNVSRATSVASPTGNPAVAIYETASAGVHEVYRPPSYVPAGNAVATISLIAKAINGRYWLGIMPLNTSSSPAKICYFNLASVATGSIYTGCSGAIADIGDGWSSISLVCPATGVASGGNLEIFLASANNTYSYTGDVTKGVYIGSLMVSLGSSEPTYQPIGASWEAQYAANAAAAGVALTLYQDSAGTTPVTGPDSVIGKLIDLSGNNSHAVQSGATGLKPVLRLDPNGYWYRAFDLVDDSHVTTFPNLGTNCVSYIDDGSTVTETTGVTLNGALTQSTPAADYGRIYLSAPSSKSAQIIKWLKAKAGLA